MFVSGLHRSGTTQLHSTLATHPDVAGMVDTGAPHDEGQHLQDVVPTARSYGGPGRFAFDARAHLTEDSPLATEDSARRLFGQWAEHWDLSRRVLVEKSPPNLIRMRFLQQLFPQARFVVVVRHPLVTALATRKLATTWWMRRTFRTAPLSVAAEHWFAAHRLLLEDRPEVRQTHLLRWEDLCARPAEVLAGIADFVGIDGRFTTPALDPAVDAKYLAAWTAMRSDPDRTTSALRRVLDGNRDLAARFGYDATEPGSLAPLPD